MQKPVATQVPEFTPRSTQIGKDRLTSPTAYTNSKQAAWEGVRGIEDSPVSDDELLDIEEKEAEALDGMMQDEAQEVEE